jgi:hypothetical protein
VAVIVVFVAQNTDRAMAPFAPEIMAILSRRTQRRVYTLRGVRE